MMRIGYLDCVGGVAGDMLLGAILGAGADRSRLESVPGELGLEGVSVEVNSVKRSSIGALAVSVRVRDRQPRRGWREIRELIDRSELPRGPRARAVEVFECLAGAEANVHGVDVDSVHFHEIGAVDSIIDICGACVLIDDLDLDRVICSPLPVSRGTVPTAHGVLPLPAPATLELLLGMPLTGVDERSELVTPTGAALVARFADGWGEIPAMRLDAIGYGAGSRELSGRPNVTRLMLGTASAEVQEGLPAPADAVLIETNLDDMSPELVPDAIARVMNVGALDAWTSPAQMKKGRPGVMLSALARPPREAEVARAMLEETTALGVRVMPMRRYELDREERELELGEGTVRVKLGFLDGHLVNVAPEHDDCERIARQTGQTVKRVWSEALIAAHSKWS